MAELSELTGISMATLADFEKGKRELSEEGEGCGFMKSSHQLRFVDLFSGLDGFHAASSTV